MHKEKAPEDRGQEMHSTDIVAAPSAADKELSTLRAIAALAGWQLNVTCGHRLRRCYVLHRWGRAIDCADLDAVRAALVRVGVQP